MKPTPFSLKKLLLNCDMGERFGACAMGMDEQIMPLVDMANIACGFHAGDPLAMSQTVSMAKQYGVTIGAHPSYPDLTGFGRRSMQCSAEEIISLVQYQIGALDGICQAQATRVEYVKPHGALYNDMMRDDNIMRAVLQSVAAYDVNLPVMILATHANPYHQSLAATYDVKLIFEGFADRAYDDNGFLLPRTQPESVYHDAQQIVDQAMLFATEGAVITVSGQKLMLNADTLCVHGDNMESIKAVQHIRTALNKLYLS